MPGRHAPPRLDHLIIQNVAREAVRAFTERFRSAAALFGVDPGSIREDECPLSLALNRMGTWAQTGAPTLSVRNRSRSRWTSSRRAGSSGSCSRPCRAS